MAMIGGGPPGGRPGMSRRQPVLTPQAKAAQTVQQAQAPGAATGMGRTLQRTPTALPPTVGSKAAVTQPTAQPGFAMRPSPGPAMTPIAAPAPLPGHTVPLQQPVGGLNRVV